MFYEIWKARSLVLNEETDQLYELNKQQEDEIKELISWRLNFKLKKILVLISSTLSVLDCKKYLILRCLLMKRTLFKRTDTEKFKVN